MTMEDIASRVKALLAESARQRRSGDLEASMDSLKSAEVLDPGNPEILCSLAALYARDGLFRTALEYADKVLALPSGYIEAARVKRVKAFALSQLGRYPEAEAALDGLVAQYPDDAESYLMLGYVREKMDSPRRALDAYRKAISLRPESPTSMNAIAYMLAKSGGDLNNALTFIKRALEKDPENAAYIDTAGYIYMKRGEADMARKYLKRALEKRPADEEIKAHLAELLRL